MIFLRINADDFGIDENRTKAILEGFKLGVVTHTTAMANMPYFDEAMKFAKQDGISDKVGLHLNLTEGPAMTDPIKDCPFFCDKEGNFKVDFHLSMKNRIMLPHKYYPILKEEIEAQMRKFRETGSTNTHLDSHHHVHTDFTVAKVAFPLAKKYGFKTIRLSRNLSNELGMIKKVYKFIYNKVKVPKDCRWSDWFGGFEDFKSNIQMVRNGDVVEIMVHPMYGKSFQELDMKHPLTDSGLLMQVEKDFYNTIEKEMVG